MAGLRNYFRPTNLLTSLLLVFPLFLIYQLGVAFVPGVLNGADFITFQLLSLLNGQPGTYILVNLGLGLLFVGLVFWLRRKNTFDTRLFVPILIESSVYALTMGTLICFVMQDVLHIDPRLAAGPPQVGLIGKFIQSIGAGVHEELVFRLIMLGGLFLIGERLLKLGSIPNAIFAFVLSSLLFSAAHHLPGGEPFRIGAFVYRFFCGIWFATLYRTRGFAQAVYTHALYDVYVMVLRG